MFCKKQNLMHPINAHYPNSIGYEGHVINRESPNLLEIHMINWNYFIMFEIFQDFKNRLQAIYLPSP